MPGHGSRAGQFGRGEVPPFLAGEPLPQLDPRASASRSITAWLSLPSVSGLPAAVSALAGPMPSARSASVVGQKQA